MKRGGTHTKEGRREEEEPRTGQERAVNMCCCVSLAMFEVIDTRVHVFRFSQKLM